MACWRIWLILERSCIRAVPKWVLLSQCMHKAFWVYRGKKKKMNLNLRRAVQIPDLLAYWHLGYQVSGFSSLGAVSNLSSVYLCEVASLERMQFYTIWTSCGLKKGNIPHPFLFPSEFFSFDQISTWLPEWSLHYCYVKVEVWIWDKRVGSLFKFPCFRKPGTAAFGGFF